MGIFFWISPRLLMIFLWVLPQIINGFPLIQSTASELGKICLHIYTTKSSLVIIFYATDFLHLCKKNICLFPERVPIDARSGPDTVLTKEEETILVDFILHMVKIGYPLTKRAVLDHVQEIILTEGRKSPFKNGRPGTH